MYDLVQAGLVVRYPRKGTFVAQMGSEENLLKFTNLLAEGPEVHGPHQVVEARVAMAGEITELSGLPADTPVNWLRRIKLNPEGRPVSVELQMVSFSHAPRLLMEPLEELTTLAYFRRQQVPIARARMYIEPAILTPEMAVELQRDPGQAVLRLRRLLWVASGELIEVVTSTFVTDDLQLYIEHTLPPSDS